jgi:hypothetical protein
LGRSRRAIAQQIVDQGGDYALALKGNQKTLHADVSLFLDDPRLRPAKPISPWISAAVVSARAQVAALTSTQMHVLSSDQIEALTGTNIPGLTSLNVTGLSSANIAGLAPTPSKPWTTPWAGPSC